MPGICGTAGRTSMWIVIGAISCWSQQWQGRSRSRPALTSPLTRLRIAAVLLVLLGNPSMDPTPLTWCGFFIFRLPSRPEKPRGRGPGQCRGWPPGPLA